jgi:quinolinate synthase
VIARGIAKDSDFMISKQHFITMMGTIHSDKDMAEFFHKSRQWAYLMRKKYGLKYSLNKKARNERIVRMESAIAACKEYGLSRSYVYKLRKAK